MEAIARFIFGFGLLMTLISTLFEFIIKKKSGVLSKKHYRLISVCVVLQIVSVILLLAFLLFVVVMLFVTAKW